MTSFTRPAAISLPANLDLSRQWLEDSADGRSFPARRKPTPMLMAEAAAQAAEGQTEVTVMAARARWGSKRGGSCRHAGAAVAAAPIELRCHPPTALADSATLFNSTALRLPVKTLKSVSFPSRQKRISRLCQT